MNKLIKRTLVLFLIIAAFIPVEKIQAADSIIPVYRSGGADRFQTAVQISQAGWSAADNVLLTYGYNFPDALSSGTLGYKLNAPILLSYTDFIPQVTINEMKRLGAKNIYIIGGTGVISSAAENSLKQNGYNVIRLSGIDRFLTNIAINNKVMENNPADTAIISYGYNFPDALAVGPYAASHGYPLLLTYTDSLRPETKDFLIKYNIKEAIITGGTGVVSAAVENALKNMGLAVTRIGGADRYETAVKISAAFDSGFDRGVSMANGNNYPDALAGIVLSAKKNIPLLLTESSYIQDNVVDYIKSRGTSSLYVFGGTGVISDTVVQEIRTPYEIIINDSIVDVFRSPDANSERVTQTLYCQEVKILEPYSDWSKVQVEDGYIGWVRSGKIDKTFKNVRSSKVIIKSKLKNIYSTIYGTSPIKQVSLGTELYCIQKSGSWYQVALPMNTTGWIEASDTLEIQTGTRIPKTTGSNFVETAKRFLDVPYLWGGTGAAGIDCSGLTYISARVNGVDLPRDAQPQYDAIPVSVTPNIAYMKPGDLIYFSSTIGSKTITHVGIYIGNNQFIHASGGAGKVTITSFSDSYFQARIVGVKRAF